MACVRRYRIWVPSGEDEWGIQLGVASTLMKTATQPVVVDTSLYSLSSPV